MAFLCLFEIANFIVLYQIIEKIRIAFITMSIHILFNFVD